MQEPDCDVCKILSKILQRLDRIEQRLSVLEQGRSPRVYDPAWMDSDSIHDYFRKG